jgi:autotransporter-associated beta strand protein
MLKSALISDRLQKVSYLSTHPAAGFAALMFLASVNVLNATAVYDSGGFESPRFAASQSLAGQDAAPPRPLGYGPWQQDAGTSTAVVQTDLPNGGLQSIKVTRVASSTGDTRWGITVPITPTAASNVVAIDFDMTANIGTGTNWGGPDVGPLFGIECYDASLGTPKLIGSLLLDTHHGDILYQQAGTGALLVSGDFIPRNEYRHYTLRANFTSKTYSIYGDDSLIHTEGFVDPTAVAFTDAPITTLAATTNSEATATGTAYFDNYTISARTSKYGYLVWNGDGAINSWDVGVSSNWFDGDNSVGFTNGASVVFDDRGSNTPAIDLQGTLQPGSVTVNASQDYAFGGAGAMSGGDGLTKRGSGTLALTGSNSYTGGTTVSNGTLLVNNATGSGTGTGPVFVAIGSTLGGSGSIAGPVTFAGGGALSPGNGVGTLTINNSLTLANGVALQFELGSNSDLLVVGGDLTLNGAFYISDGGGFGAGTYNLIGYGGALINKGIFLAGAPSGYDYRIDTSTSGQINLVVTTPPLPPAAPGGLMATALSDTQISLAWTDNSTNETSFLIERSANNSTFT